MSDSNPWGSSTSNSIDNNIVQDNQGFADNFNDKLPDHEEYLNRLETKLNNLKKKSSIAQELRNRRSDEARRMLDASAAAVELYEDSDLTENSAMNRRLFPEKQALTLSEIAKLLENDTLAQEVNKSEVEEPDQPEKSADNNSTSQES